MSYSSWFNAHADKHKAIVEKLQKKNLTTEEIIEYFDFENMLINENDFCPLYKEPKKCHDLDKLNCYLCACPNFRFNDDGVKKVQNRTKYSFCDINSKDGKAGIYGEAIHQDCSGCTVPHHVSYIKKNFDLDWKRIMFKCNIG